MPMPSRAMVPGSGACATATESSFKKPGSSRKLKVSAVVAPVAVAVKPSTWYGVFGGLFTLISVVPPKVAEKLLADKVAHAGHGGEVLRDPSS